MDIFGEGDELYLTTSTNEYRMRLRWQEEAVVADGLLGFGRRLIPRGDQLLMDGMALSRRDSPKLPQAPERWRELVGFYGWDHNTLEIRINQDGRLEVLIEWFAAYPLEEVGKDTFCFPSSGLTTPSRSFSTETPRDISSASMQPVSNSSVAGIEA